VKGELGTAIGVLALVLAGLVASQSQNPNRTIAAPENAADQPTVKVIEVTARKYEYSPREMHVKVGTRVQWKVRALDRTHGMKISLYPEGAPEGGQPGLRFTELQDNWKLEKDQERIIEFVAVRPGTYPIKCSVVCGLGHRGMKGKLVVEE